MLVLKENIDIRAEDFNQQFQNWLNTHYLTIGIKVSLIIYDIAQVYL